MGTTNISVEIGRSIEIEVGQQTINLDATSLTTANYVVSDGKFYFDGQGGDVYFKYNSTTKLFELWVNGTKEGAWGKVSGGSPFA